MERRIHRSKWRAPHAVWLLLLCLLSMASAPAHGAESYQWSRRATGTGNEIGRSVVVDSTGNIIIAGEFTGTVAFGPFNLTATSANTDVYIAKMDPLGNFLWAVQVTGTGTEVMYAPNSVAVDSANNIYITGRFDSADAAFGSFTGIAATGAVDIFVAKLNPAGVFQWVNHPTSGGGNSCRGRGIVADAAGNTYVVGHVTGTATFNTAVATVLTSLTAGSTQDIFVCKINTTGTAQWAVLAGGTGTDDAFGIALAPGGTDPYICGFTNSTDIAFAPLAGTQATTGANDVVVAKLNGANGNFVYAVLAGGNGADQANGIAVDAAGEAIITGAFTGNATFAPLAALNAQGTSTDVFVAQLNAAGTAFLKDLQATSNNAADSGNAIVNAGGTNYYITGDYSANITFGAFAAQTNAGVDIFIAKLDIATSTWVARNKGTSAALDSGHSVAVDASNHAIITGEYAGNVTFATTPVLNNSGGNDIFIAKYGLVTPGVTLLESGGNTNVTEGGATDTYVLALNSVPTANVVITPTPDAFSTVAPPSLTFTNANWSVPQTFTVTAANDAIAQGAHTSTITHAAASGDVNYNGGAVTIPNVVANVTDNDTVGVIVTETGGTTNVTEGGATDSYTVVLTSMPLGNVTITPSSNTATGVTTSGALTFLPGNWNIAQTITVTAVDDPIVEGPLTDAISHVATSPGDPAYAGIAVASVTANITDNDVAGVTVTQSGGTTVVTEGGATDTYTLVLTSQPSANVDITVAPDANSTVGAATVTFTGGGAGNWNVPQTVTVTAVDNPLADGPHTSTITHSAASGDANYNGGAVTIASVVATVNDNDPATFTVTPSALTLDEAVVATTQTFTVHLDSQPPPTLDVVVDVASADTVLGVTVDKPSLTFTNGNWNVDQTVTVTVINDNANETSPHNCNVTLTVNNGLTTADAYDSAVIAPLTYAITDNDPIGVTVVNSGLNLDEAAVATTQTFDVKLITQPATGQVVVIDLASDTVQGVTLNKANLTFNNANWNVIQTVTVTVVNDAVAEANPHNSNVTLTVNNGTTTANEYDSFVIPNLTYSIADNDSAGITVVESGGSTSVSETGPTADTFTMVLNSQPTASVTISFTSDTTLGVTTSATLTFTTVTWNVPQTVTVTAIDDTTIEANPHTDTVNFTVASTDLNYSGFAVPGVAASIADNDAPTIVLTLTGGTNAVTEGGATDTFDVRLGSQPTVADGTVTVTFTCSVAGRVTFVPPSYTFVRTANDWSTDKTVTVTAVNDSIAEGTQTYTIFATASSATLPPTGYDTASSNTPVTVTDNESAGLVVTGAPAVNESGATNAIFQVRLSSQPTGNVTVTATSTDTVTGVTVQSPPRTYTPISWNVNQNFNIKAIDDFVDEGVTQNVNLNLTFTGGDPTYNALAATVVAVTVTDDDTAGVIVSSTGNLLTEGLAATQSFFVHLQSQPAGAQVVVIDLAAADTVKGVTISTNQLTFNNANWNFDQTVTVTVVDDQFEETNPANSNVTLTINAPLTTANEFDAIVIPDQVYSIYDNDQSAVKFSTASTEFDFAFAGQTGSIEQTHACAVDRAGNMYIAGYFTGPISFGATNLVPVASADNYAAKFNPDGTLAWARAYGGPGAERILALATDPAGNLYCTGQFNNTMSFAPLAPITANGNFDTFVGRIDTANGDFLWVTQAGVAGMSCIGWGIGADAQAVYVSGEFGGVTTFPGYGAVGTFGGQDAYTASIDPATGLFNWVRTIGTASGDGGQGIAVDNSGKVYTVGRYSPSGSTVPAGPFLLPAGTGASTYVAVYDALGNVVAANGIVSTSSVVGLGLGVDRFHNIYVTGYFNTQADFGTFSLFNVQTTAFLAKYDSSAGFIWAQALISSSSSQAMRIAVDPAGTSYLAGTFTNDLFVPGFGFFGTAGSNLFVLSADTAGNFTTPRTFGASSFIGNDIALDGTGNLIVAGDLSGSANFGLTNTVSSGLSSSPFLARLVPTLFTTEGGATATFDAVLTAKPLANVTVTLSPGGQQTVGTPVLTFTSANWFVPQTVTVTAVDDPIAEATPHAGSVSGTVTSADPIYNGIAAGRILNQISDNDVPGVSTTELGGSTDVTEGGVTDTYSVQLISQPAQDVIITITSDATQVSLDKSTLTFTSGNWNVPQVVTVTAVDDPLIESSPHFSLITQTAASADPFYNGIAVASVTVNITDNDAAAVTVTESGGTTDVTEGGVTDTYTLVLTAQPLTNVVVNISTDPQVTTNVASVTFTPALWNVPQTVTVTAVDDLVDEVSPHNGVITHTTASLDPNFSGLIVSSVTANVTDNDVAAVLVVETFGVTNITEGGATDVLRFTLATQPTANVTVTITPDTQSSVNITTRTFTPLNWNVVQTVTVTAVDDLVAEGPHTSTITISNASADPFYNAGGIIKVNAVLGNTVTANITDNDAPSVLLLPVTGSVDTTEGGATSSYDVRLGTQPTANVTITLTPDAQSTLSTGTLTFTTVNWNVNQNVVVTAVDDNIAEGAHTSTITHTAASFDGFYNGLAIPDMIANITDNDFAQVTILESGSSTDVTEGGITDTYDVVLATQPTATITVTVTPDTQVTVDKPSLTFDNLNWNVPQTVTVTAVDDLVAESTPHPGVITHTVTSTDPFYNALPTNNVVANITDNDTAAIQITQSAASTDVVEDGATDSFDVVLATLPTANVTVTLTPDAQTTVNPTTLTFTPGNYLTPQPVTVTAVLELPTIVVGAAAPPELPIHPGVITATTASADGFYNVNGVFTVDGTPGNLVTANVTDKSIRVISPGFGQSQTIDPTPGLGAVRTAGVVTVTTTAAHLLSPGQVVTVSGVTDAAFTGTFTVTSIVSPTVFTYAQPSLADASSDSGTVAVVVPETWNAGSTHSLNWVASGAVANIIIEYSSIGDFSDTVVVNTVAANSNPFTFTVPNVATASGRVRLIDSVFGNIYGESSPFSIVVPSIQVLAPNGTEIFNMDDPTTVQWSFIGNIPNVSIEVSNRKQVDIAANGISRLTNVVSVTTVSAHGYAVNDSVIISGVSNSSFNGTFTITSVTPTAFTYSQVGADAVSTGGSTLVLVWQPIPSLAGIPNTGSVNWNVETPGTVITTASRATNLVTITTATPTPIQVGDSVLIKNVTDATFNGTQTVTAVISPTQFSYIQAGGNTTSGGGTVHESTQTLRLRVVDPTQPTLFDFSDRDFSVFNPGIFIVTPNGGETINRNNNFLIQWLTVPNNASIASVDIEVSIDGGVTWPSFAQSDNGTTLVDANGIPNNGSFLWKVNQPATQTAKVRVRNHVGGLGVGISVSSFTILGVFNLDQTLITLDPVVKSSGFDPDLTPVKVFKLTTEEDWAITNIDPLTSQFSNFPWLQVRATGPANPLYGAAPGQGLVGISHPLYVIGSGPSYRLGDIVATLGLGASRTAGVVTITTTSAHGYLVGDKVAIAGVNDVSFNSPGASTFTITTVPTSTTFTYIQAGPNATSEAGTTAIYPHGVVLSQQTIDFQVAMDPGNLPEGDYVGLIRLKGLNTGSERLVVVRSTVTDAFRVHIPLINKDLISSDAQGTVNYEMMQNFTGTLPDFLTIVQNLSKIDPVTFSTNATTNTPGKNWLLVNSNGSGWVTSLPPQTAFPVPIVILTTNGAVRTSGSVTINTVAAHNYKIGDSVTIAGVTDASFDGNFVVTAVTATTFAYLQAGPDSVSGSGTASIGPDRVSTMVRINKAQLPTAPGVYTGQVIFSASTGETRFVNVVVTIRASKARGKRAACDLNDDSSGSALAWMAGLAGIALLLRRRNGFNSAA